MLFRTFGIDACGVSIEIAHLFVKSGVLFEFLYFLLVFCLLWG